LSFQHHESHRYVHLKFELPLVRRKKSHLFLTFLDFSLQEFSPKVSNVKLGQNITKIPDSLHLSELCEVCSGKDDEDLYIVFNALYRIIIGEVFQAAPDKSSEENDLNSLSMNSSQQKQQDFQTSQEKLQIFRKAATQQTLIDIISSPRFDLLLREIFKSKYSRVQDTSCKHRELAM